MKKSKIQEDQDYTCILVPTLQEGNGNECGSWKREDHEDSRYSATLCSLPILRTASVVMGHSLEYVQDPLKPRSPALVAIHHDLRGRV